MRRSKTILNSDDKIISRWKKRGRGVRSLLRWKGVSWSLQRDARILRSCPCTLRTLSTILFIPCPI